MKIKLQIRNMHQMKENFIYFYQNIPKLDDRGFRVSKIDILQLGNFLQFFSTKLEKIENIDFYIFPCNSDKN